MLSDLGIILVILPHLAGTHLDGAAMCRADGTPVIALTLRRDKIDNFWFTLLHEFAHVAKHLTEERGLIVDDLEISSMEEIEKEADQFAEDALISADDWATLRKGAYIAGADIEELAKRAGVNVAIVAADGNSGTRTSGSSRSCSDTGLCASSSQNTSCVRPAPRKQRICPLGRFDLPQQLLRLRDQLPEVHPFRLHLRGEHAVLEGVLVPFRRPGSSRAAMHSAALLAGDRRRLAGRALAGFRPTARAGPQSRSVARMTTGHDEPEWVWRAARPGRTRPHQ